jgi:diacylglycerol kinase (ATP)
MSSVESLPASGGPVPNPVTEATAAVIYNPVKVDVDDLKRIVEAERAAGGWNTLWFETTEEDPGGGQAAQALEAGATLVIAAGGDGTVRAVAEVLAGTDAALSLLPSGTGNLLARNLDLTMDDTEHSIRTAYTGTDRRIDVAVIDIARPDGTTDTHSFLVMAGVGLDAKIMNNTDPDLKAKVGWLAYARALAGVLREKDYLRIKYRSDQQHQRRRPGRAQAVIVGNCGSLPANILLLPDAVVDDGLLDVVILKPESFGGWVQVVFKVFWENGIVRRTKAGRKLDGVDVAAVDLAQLPEFEVRLSRADEIQLDGDPFGQAVGFATRVDAGALRLKVPANG